MSDQFTTRLRDHYALALVSLRAGIVSMTDGATRDILMKKVDDLGELLANGVEPLVQVAQAELEAERAREGLPLGDFVELPSDVSAEGLLADREPVLSAARDNRGSA